MSPSRFGPDRFVWCRVLEGSHPTAKASSEIFYVLSVETKAGIKLTLTIPDYHVSKYLLYQYY